MSGNRSDSECITAAGWGYRSACSISIAGEFVAQQQQRLASEGSQGRHSKKPISQILERVHSALDHRSQSNTLKHDATTTVVAAKVCDLPVIIKRFNRKSVWHGLTRAVRMTRARRCWEMSLLLRELGLHTAE